LKANTFLFVSLSTGIFLDHKGNKRMILRLSYENKLKFNIFEEYSIVLIKVGYISTEILLTLNTTKRF
jgi:hypothetical protein